MFLSASPETSGEDHGKLTCENYFPGLLFNLRIYFSLFSLSGTVVISLVSACKKAFRTKVSSKSKNSIP